MLRSTGLLIVLIGLALPISASAVEFALDRFTLSGTVSFDDEFDDGSLNLPPTSGMPDQVGTTTEAGGFRLFTETDGASIVPVMGGSIAVDTATVTNAAIMSGGSALTSIEGVWRADLPPGDPLVQSSYGIGLDDPSASDIETIFLIVRSDGASVFIDFTDRFFFAGRETLSLATFAAATSVVLGLDLDHTTGLVTPRYSLDGGATFVQGSNWGFAATPIAAFQTTPSMFAFAQGVSFLPVPEPALTLLLCLAGLGAAARRRRIA